MRGFRIASTLLLLAGFCAPPAAAQLLSARTEALGPDLAGLYPDDWSDAVVNPALLAPGALAFGRLDWSAAQSPGRRFLLGGRMAAEPAGLLVATSRGLEPEGPRPAMSHTLIAARYGRVDAVGFRYAAYDYAAAPHSPHGYAFAAGARTAAGKGWSAEFLAELAEVGFSEGRGATYRAGELLLRQPAPERTPRHPGWDQRALRVRGGVGNGDFRESARGASALREWTGDMRWLEAGLVHLHAFTAAASRYSLAWAVRYTLLQVDPLPCSGEDCDGVGADRRGVLALDSGIEVRLRVPLTLRGGFTWAARARGQAPIPGDWGYLAGVKPSRFESGLWLGLGAQVAETIAVDAAVDARAADRSLERTPVLIQATYRF